MGPDHWRWVKVKNSSDQHPIVISYPLSNSTTTTALLYFLPSVMEHLNLKNEVIMS